MIQKIQQYLQESVAELKKVSWPTRDQATRDAVLVIGISLGVAIFLGILDYIFNYGLQNLIDTLK